MAGRTQGTKQKSNSFGLTDQQILFCREYARRLNLGEAYEAAKYKFSSRSSRDAQATRLARNDRIQAYLREIMDLDEVSVVNAVTAVALTPITEVIHWDGRELIVRQTDQWSDRAKLAVKKLKAKTKTTVNEETGETFIETEIEVEMYDRLSALDKLMRKLKLYPRELQTLDCISHLASKGLLLPGQAEAIISGLDELEARLQSVSTSQGKAEQKRGISDELAAEIRARIMGINAESVPPLPSAIPDKPSEG